MEVVYGDTMTVITLGGVILPPEVVPAQTSHHIFVEGSAEGAEVLTGTTSAMYESLGEGS